MGMSSDHVYVTSTREFRKRFETWDINVGDSLHEVAELYYSLEGSGRLDIEEYKFGSCRSDGCDPTCLMNQHVAVQTAITAKLCYLSPPTPALHLFDPEPNQRIVSPTSPFQSVMRFL
jgi:hypothetical protein